MPYKQWENFVLRFNENDSEDIRQMIPNENALDWMRREVPVFECPDKTLEEIYYFRWWVFRKHIRHTKEGRIVTEFLPSVSWAGPCNSIVAAAGHHIAEARWLRSDCALAEEYIRFWFRGSGVKNAADYSSWLIFAVYQYALISGNSGMAVDLLPELTRFYESVENSNLTQYGLFWSCDDRDAMEFSISGSGLRPTLNSYMYANASAIFHIAEWAKEEKTSQKYRKKAEALREKIQTVLWDPKAEFYKVVPLASKTDTVPCFSFDQIPAEHNVREQLGYLPFGFGIADASQDEAWKYLMDERYFFAGYGPTTAERNHSGYLRPAHHECLWNGPSWPFATTQTLNGLVETLQTGKSHRLCKTDFMKLLTAYANSHYRVNEKGKKVNWLDENLHPDTGEWLSRSILEGWNWPGNKGGYERGKDYNHSAFCDLIIRGVCGILPLEGKRLLVCPLVPQGYWPYFSLENVPYKGHLLTVRYDVNGSRYKESAGLTVKVDGQCAARENKLVPLEVIL